MTREQVNKRLQVLSRYSIEELLNPITQRSIEEKLEQVDVYEHALRPIKERVRGGT